MSTFDTILIEKMTDLLFVTETEKVTALNHNYRYQRITTMYMNKLTIDITDNTEIIGNIYLPFEFYPYRAHNKNIDREKQSKQYSNKKRFGSPNLFFKGAEVELLTSNLVSARSSIEKICVHFEE